MPHTRPPLWPTLGRCLLLRCPVCGRAAISARPFSIRHHCPACAALFKREDGFFVGAIMLNVVATEGILLVVYLGLLLLPRGGPEDGPLFTALFILAGLLPVALYHHSWSVWLAFDHLIETLPRHTGRPVH